MLKASATGVAGGAAYMAHRRKGISIWRYNQRGAQNAGISNHQRAQAARRVAASAQRALKSGVSMRARQAKYGDGMWRGGKRQRRRRNGKSGAWRRGSMRRNRLGGIIASWRRHQGVRRKAAWRAKASKCIEKYQAENQRRRAASKKRCVA